MTVRELLCYLSDLLSSGELSPDSCVLIDDRDSDCCLPVDCIYADSDGDLRIIPQ